jgi:cbb3-type cytochrome oxidase maturation protein
MARRTRNVHELARGNDERDAHEDSVEILIVLVPVSVLLVGVAVWFFFWAADHGQFEDLDKAAESILQDDEELGEGS